MNPEDEEQRIAELQSTVINYRRQMPKTYCKLLKIENKHFHKNLQNGVCTIPNELRDISFSQAEETLAQCLYHIEALTPQQEQDDTVSAASIKKIEQRSKNVQITRQMFQRLQKKRVSQSSEQHHQSPCTAASIPSLPKS